LDSADLRCICSARTSFERQHFTFGYVNKLVEFAFFLHPCNQRQRLEVDVLSQEIQSSEKKSNYASSLVQNIWTVRRGGSKAIDRPKRKTFLYIQHLLPSPSSSSFAVGIPSRNSFASLSVGGSEDGTVLPSSA